MAKKKTGSIAVPYLVTMFIAILILGGGTFFLLNYLGILNGDKELPEPPAREITTVTYADNHTILFILDEPEQKCPTTFMLMRSVPKDRRVVFLGIPTNTIAVIDGNQQNLKDAYDTGGVTAAVNFTEQVFGVTVDRYMKLDSPAFVKICSILGGVTYPVAEDVAGFNSEGKEIYLSAENIDKYVTYAAFKDGEVERAYNASSVVTAMVNQASGVRVADNLDISFNTVINMVETNITAVDYQNHKFAIKDMLERGNSIATFYILNGENAYDDFIPSQSFIADFVNTYYSYDENTGESDSESE